MCAALRGAPRSASHELNLWPPVAAKKPIHAAAEPLFADHGDRCAAGEAVVVAGSIGSAEPGTPDSIGVSRARRRVKSAPRPGIGRGAQGIRS